MLCSLRHFEWYGFKKDILNATTHAVPRIVISFLYKNGGGYYQEEKKMVESPYLSREIYHDE